jgi:hypothetical protein
MKILSLKNIRLQTLFALLLSCACFSFANATENEGDEPIVKNRGSLDFSVGVYSKAFSSAFAWNQQYALGKNKRIILGYGVRFTSFVGKEQAYVTAPASVSEGNFFKPQNQTKLDTVFVPNAQSNSLNAAIHLAYGISPKLQAGFNIDAAGFSFGKKSSGSYESYSEGNQPKDVNLSVTPVNLLLTGDYDWGSLNSEMYLQYKISETLSLRGGAAFLFSEYTSDTKLAFDNDRFRRKSLGGLFAIRYRL